MALELPLELPFELAGVRCLQLLRELQAGSRQAALGVKSASSALAMHLHAAAWGSYRLACCWLGCCHQTTSIDDMLPVWKGKLQAWTRHVVLANALQLEWWQSMCMVLLMGREAAFPSS